MFKKLLLLTCCFLASSNNFGMHTVPVTRATKVGAITLLVLAAGVKEDCTPKGFLRIVALGGAVGATLSLTTSLYRKGLVKMLGSDPNVAKILAINALAHGAGFATAFGAMVGYLIALTYNDVPRAASAVMSSAPFLFAWGAISGGSYSVGAILDSKRLIKKYGAESLHVACAHNDLDTVEYCIALGIPINGKCSIGRTPLHEAVVAGNKEIVSYLLKQRADISAQDNAGWTALHLAAYEGNKELAAYLIRQGADPKAQEMNRATFVYLAAQNGHKDVVESLFGNHFSPQALPLSVAPNVEQSLKEKCLITVLNNTDAYKNLINNFPALGQWSFDVLAQHGSLKLQQQLAQTWKQQKNNDQVTSLLTTHANRHLVGIQDLIAMKTSRNATVRDIAQMNNHQGMVQLLDDISGAQDVTELDPDLQELMVKNFKTRLAIR